MSLVGEPLPLQVFAEVWIPEVVKSHLENRGILRATMIETFDDPQFAVRAAKLIGHISSRLAAIVQNPSKRRDKHAQNIQQSMAAIMAILDQDLFYLREGKPHKLSKEKIERLKRIFVASMDTP